MSYAVQFTLKSSNVKTGPMPVSTTSSNTCPDACPLRDNGCYAAAGPLGAMWRALSATTAGETFRNGRGTVQTYTWEQFCRKIEALPVSTLFGTIKRAIYRGRATQSTSTRCPH